MRTLSIILIVPGLIVFYAMFLRNALKSIPALRKFYAEADGFWASIWALCGKSLTIAWSYAVIALGAAVQAIDPLAAALGDPELRQQITSAFADPKVIGYITIAMSVITILARLRGIAKDAG